MPPEAAIEQPIDSVTDDVRAAVAELKGEAPPENLAASDTPADVGADDAPPPIRQRNERGQFIKADGTVDADQRPDPAPKVTDVDPATASSEQPSTAVAAPSSWSAEAKAEFSKLPPAVQAAAVKREAEINEGGRRWSEEKQTLMSHFEPVRGLAERHRVHPGEAIKRLAAAADALDRDPYGTIMYYAKEYGLDLSKPATEQPTHRPQTDPVVASLSEKVSYFERMFQEQEQTRVADTLTSFATQPGHDHFETVKADMGRLMMVALQTGQPMTLQDAYDQAVWANPTTRTSMLASQNAAATAAQRQKEATDKARRGALSVNGSPNGAVVPNRTTVAGQGTSVVDDVRAALEQLRH